MDGKDRAIGTQVAFKGAVDLCHDLDLVTPEGQQQFALVFTFLTDALMSSMDDATAQAAQVIRGNFPGTQTEYPQNQSSGGYAPQQQQMPTGQLTIKGERHPDPIPSWLYAAAAEKGVTEVWDNRAKAMGTKRPWFRSTTGGDDAPAFWPPR